MCVAKFADFAAFQCCLHCTVGFVVVEACSAKAAFGRELEKLPETVGDIGFVLIVEAQNLDARGVNEIPAKTEREHFCKGGGVLAFAGIIADFTSAKFELRL